MIAMFFFLLIVALLFGAGFALDVLWILALVALGVWVVGFLMRGAERTWYRW